MYAIRWDDREWDIMYNIYIYMLYAIYIYTFIHTHIYIYTHM
jgi:hypothetical protein